MTLSASHRIARLWKPVAVCALLLTIAGSLGIYMYAHRQYAFIRATEYRTQWKFMHELCHDLQTVSEQDSTSMPFFLREHAQIRKYLDTIFLHLPALVRVTIFDQQGNLVVGKERPGFMTSFTSPSPDSRTYQEFQKSPPPLDSPHVIQLPLTLNHQPLLLRGDFAPTGSTTSLDQVTRITLQIAIIAIILMILLGITLIFIQITSHLSSRQHRLEEYVLSLQKANEDLQRTQRELQISEKLASLGYLSAGVAHEIGNPLAAALGYIELLQKTAFDPEKRQDILQRTEKEIERIRRIIQELVTFSRPHAIKRQMLDVNMILRELVNRFPEPPEKAVDMRLKLTEFPLFASIDPQKLQSVFYNILCNAIDAIPASGQICISTSRRIRETTAILGGSEVIAIEISDTGHGIQTDQLPRIFEPFFTTKEPGRGMGLGLPLCHRIIESLNGEITVQSIVGQGTIVTVFLPPARKPSQVAQAPSKE